jgi:hypothetical protein
MTDSYISETIEDQDGTNRLVLIYVYVDIPGWPPESAADFLSLRWEVRSSNDWETKIELGSTELEKVLGDRASVSRLYSFDPFAGRAVIQLSTNGPTDSHGHIWCLYTWRDWDLLNNREYRFIEISEDIFGAPEDKFAAKCEMDAESKLKRFAEQASTGQPATNSQSKAKDSDQTQP